MYTRWGSGTPRRHPTRATVALVACVALAFFATPAFAAVPKVYRETLIEKVGSGVTHTSYVRKGPDEVVNVARISRDAPYVLRAVPAMDDIGVGLERTSAICRRVKCALAVNGDFWKRGTNTPIGGVISGGRLLRAPQADHAQVTITDEGGVRTGPIKLTASLVPDDLKTLGIAAVNRAPKQHEIVLLTPATGDSTTTKKGTTELVLRAIRPKGFVTLAKTTIVKLASVPATKGDTRIPKDGAVLAARGKGAASLRDLLKRIADGKTSREALLRVESLPGAVESVGGSPVLVSGGKIVPTVAASDFVRGRHPRTLIGWTPKGEVLLVTIDGRQPGYSDGVTLAEAARLMVNLGASDAVNLDGGGSTTFVKRGKVTNRPSDRAIRTFGGVRVTHERTRGRPTLGNVERPVAIALALVPKDSDAVSYAPDLRDIDIPLTVDDTTPHDYDVASDPTAAMPAIVYRDFADDRPLRAAAIALLALATALAAGWSGYLRGANAGRRPAPTRR
ncbi:MAG: phosphodiester glycosidase family protein, partial [Actinomycetota bacterium]